MLSAFEKKLQHSWTEAAGYLVRFSHRP